MINICVDCGHRHRGVIECNYCDCGHTPLIMTEDNMVKKIIKWIWKVICWPFKKIHQWLTASLPK